MICIGPTTGDYAAFLKISTHTHAVCLRKIADIEGVLPAVVQMQATSVYADIGAEMYAMIKQKVKGHVSVEAEDVLVQLILNGFGWLAMCEANNLSDEYQERLRHITDNKTIGLDDNTK